MKTGYSTIPRIRVPAFIQGDIVSFNLAHLEGQWGIVCCLPRLEFFDAVFLNQHLQKVVNQGVSVLGLLPIAHPFLDPHVPNVQALGIPLLADPSQRLHRALGLSKTCPADRCHSFIFDTNRVIRYHLIHCFNWRGLSFLVEMLNHCQDQSPRAGRHIPSNPLTKTVMREPPQGLLSSPRARLRPRTQRFIAPEGVKTPVAAAISKPGASAKVDDRSRGASAAMSAFVKTGAAN